ncbi:hypothetical protein FBR05_07050 [Deltaproteobacteria bacterium PRO3]|nr:hypothetical protein [Deltaproteobacteria bacterium PRO3]
MSGGGEFQRHWRYVAGLSARADDVNRLFDRFVLAAIATILTVRAFLWLTGYPQIGGKGLHIAHMLWGGLLMLAALILMQSIITRWARHWGALIGGVGFGLFIDEVGKFVTQDNDYFYRPTFAIIYVLFVLLYLVTRALLRGGMLTPHEALVNSIEYLKEGALMEMDADNKGRALALAKAADPANPFTAPVQGLLESVEALPPREAYFWERWAAWFRGKYLALMNRPSFRSLLVAVFLGAALIDLIEYRARLPELLRDPNALSFSDKMGIGSGLASSLFVLIGGLQLLRRRRLLAYRFFEKALLISLLINQVFVFVRVQLLGILDLVLVLFLLSALRYMIRQEERAAAA